MLPSLPGMESDHGFDTIAAIGQQMLVAPGSQSWESHREDMARTRYRRFVRMIRLVVGG